MHVNARPGANILLRNAGLQDKSKISLSTDPTPTILRPKATPCTTKLTAAEPLYCQSAVLPGTTTMLQLVPLHCWYRYVQVLSTVTHLVQPRGTAPLRNAPSVACVPHSPAAAGAMQ